MGVHGLWHLIEPSGQPIPLHLLENKVLAVDVSIWLHQAVKGFREARGASKPNAHLLGIYHRLCKLLYLRIRPVFVFDGGVPVLKKETTLKRNSKKHANRSEANRFQKILLNTLLQHSAVNKVLSEKEKTNINTTLLARGGKHDADELFALPPSVSKSAENSSEEYSSSGDDDEFYDQTTWDLHSIDTTSPEFLSLPINVRHEILIDLKETRKQSSWQKVHALPTNSGQFSSYQMKRLLKRQEVQNALDQTRKDMGGQTLSLTDLESILTDQGVIASSESSSCVTNRIASDENKRYIFIKSIKEALEHAKQTEQNQQQAADDNKSRDNSIETINDSTEYSEELQQAIKMSLDDFVNTTTDIITTKHPDNTEDSTSDSHLNSVEQKVEFMLDSTSATDAANNSCSDSQSICEDGNAIKANASANFGLISSTSSTEQQDTFSINKDNVSAKHSVFSEKVQSSTLDQTQTSISEQPTATCSQFIQKSLPKNHMSSSDGESSDEFVEVTDNPPASCSSIYINPTSQLTHEDDLFKDIFEESHVKTPASELCEPCDIVQPAENSTNVSTNVNSDNVPNAGTAIAENYVYSVDEMKELKKSLEEKAVHVESIMNQKERMATNISEQIYQETQELLHLFGVPYVIAPMEAEAQCAFLEDIQLTDGTITDDSDIWLFGGKTVYKNFFNSNQQVLEFKSTNIRRYFKLSREEMILLALLVGSDYTEGLKGVGPVTALEILATFPINSTATSQHTSAHLLTGLYKFREWLQFSQSSNQAKLRAKLANVEICESFPSTNVVDSYLHPEIDNSKEPFTWSVPDFQKLVAYSIAKFCWTRHKAEQVLEPVVKRYASGKSAGKTKIHFDYMPLDEHAVQQKMSKRVKSALDRFGQSEDDVTMAEAQCASTSTKQKAVLEHNSNVVKVHRKRSRKSVPNPPSTVSLPNVVKPAVIPQKEKRIQHMLNAKLKAVEVLQQSKEKQQNRKVRKQSTTVHDANLSDKKHE